MGPERNESDIHNNKLPTKTYISPRVPTMDGPIRIASKVIDSEGLQFAKLKNEVLLRRTKTGRTEIVAKFLEDDRRLTVLTIQAFNGNNGDPQKTHFSFIGDEIPRLLDFLHNIAVTEFKDSNKVNITDIELRKLILSKEQAKNLVHENQDIFSEVVQSELTKKDIVAFGYRKKQLSIFSKLLSDREFFDGKKLEKSLTRDEDLWQRFFELNEWVFGYGLSYFFVTGFDNKKLEQVVQGHDLLNHGKRIDALMKTRGIINSLCFVEIKTSQTKLLDSSAYRSGCWAPSKELAGAVAQVQGTVAVAMQNLYGMVRTSDKEGNPTGEVVFNFKPRAFIVAGLLSEFVSEHGVNYEQLRSFEIFRNSIEGLIF